MKYLITGGAGFIGSHLADDLVRKNHNVEVYDDISTGSLENLIRSTNKKITLTIANILDINTLEKSIINADKVIHLAAAVGVKLIMENPVESIITNVHGTGNVLKLCNYHNKRLFIASTSEVYGKTMEKNTKKQNLSEDDDWTLGKTSTKRWSYACSKAIDEFLSLAYHYEKKCEIVIGRFFNIVGPRQTGRYGMVIPNFVQSALRGDNITIHGDGTQSRCFTHVKDAVNIVQKLMTHKKYIGHVFNIGNSSEITINELAQKVKTKCNSNSKIVHVPYNKIYNKGFEDMKKRTPDLKKLKKFTGYQLKYDLNQILNEVIQFNKANITASH